MEIFLVLAAILLLVIIFKITKGIIKFVLILILAALLFGGITLVREETPEASVTTEP